MLPVSLWRSVMSQAKCIASGRCFAQRVGEKDRKRQISACV